MGKIKKMKIERAKERDKDITREIKREPILPLHVLSREDYLTAIVLSILTFVVYAFTAAPGVTLADSGDFIMGVLTLGIVHAPGYPLYTVLGHLFSLLPFGAPAFRVNLFSALWGSLCLGLVFLILRTLSIDRTHAVFATLFLGFTTVFWSQTGVAEVYSFNGFLIACIFFWILAYNRDKKRSQLYLIFLTTGLALSNHYPLVILSGVGLVFLLDRRDIQIGDYLKGLLFLGLGLTPYLYLFIQAANPDMQYNCGKISDPSMVIDHILRKSYSNRYGGTVWDKFILAFTFLKATTANFLFATLFLFFGIAHSFSAKCKYRYPILTAALSTSLGLTLILTFPSTDDFKTLFLAYFVPPFLFLTVFLALGLKQLMTRYVKHKAIQVCVLLILFVTQVGFNFGSSSHHNDTLAERWATELLNSLKPDSILILGPSQFPTYYLQLIKGLRQDVRLYDRFSLYTRNNLYSPRLLFRYSSKDADELRKRPEQELIHNSLVPIYYTRHVGLVPNINSSLTPFVYRVDKKHSEASHFNRIRVSERLLDSLVDDYPKSEHWLDSKRTVIFSRLIPYYGKHDRREVKRILEYLMRTKLYSDPGFILPLANNVYYLGNHDLARTFYERADELSLEAFSATDLAVFCSLLANAGDYEKALGICIRQEQSTAPCEVNTIATRERIAGIYREQRKWIKVAEYSGKILQCQPEHKIALRYLELARQTTK